MNSRKLPKCISPFSFKTQILRLTWEVACFFLYRPFIPNFFNRWRIFILKCFGAQIGKGSIVYASTRIWGPWNMEVGELVCIGPRVDFYSADKIRVGNKVTISQDSCLCTASHHINDINKPFFSEPITIEDFVWVCARAFVMPGCHIGTGCVVGACSVVCKNIPDWEVHAGSPASFIKKRFIK